MPPSESPLVPRQDLVELLGEAAELAARSEGRREDSIPLAEVEKAAREAGIEPAFVRQAFERRRAGARSLGDRLLGPAGTWIAEERIPGTIDPDAAVRLLGELQLHARIPGGTVEKHGRGSWRLAGGAKGLVQVNADGEEVGVSILADRGTSRVLLLGGGFGLGGLAGSQFGGMLGAVGGSPEAMAVGIALGGVAGAVAGLSGGSALWKAAAARWKRRAESALSRARERIGRLTPTPSSEDAGEPDQLGVGRSTD